MSIKDTIDMTIDMTNAMNLEDSKTIFNYEERFNSKERITTPTNLSEKLFEVIKDCGFHSSFHSFETWNDVKTFLHKYMLDGNYKSLHNHYKVLLTDVIRLYKFYLLLLTLDPDLFLNNYDVFFHPISGKILITINRTYLIEGFGCIELRLAVENQIKQIDEMVTNEDSNKFLKDVGCTYLNIYSHPDHHCDDIVSFSNTDEETYYTSEIKKNLFGGKVTFQDNLIVRYENEYDTSGFAFCLDYNDHYCLNDSLNDSLNQYLNYGGLKMGVSTMIVSVFSILDNLGVKWQKEGGEVPTWKVVIGNESLSGSSILITKSNLREFTLKFVPHN